MFQDKKWESESPLALSHFFLLPTNDDRWTVSWKAYVKFLQWYEKQNSRMKDIFQDAASPIFKQMMKQASQNKEQDMAAAFQRTVDTSVHCSPFCPSGREIAEFLKVKRVILNQFSLLKKAKNIQSWLHSMKGNTTCSLFLMWHPYHMQWIKIPCSQAILDKGSLYCMKLDRNTFFPTNETLSQATVRNETHSIQSSSNIQNLFTCSSGAIVSPKFLCSENSPCNKESKVNCNILLHRYKLKEVITGEWFSKADKSTTKSSVLYLQNAAKKHKKQEHDLLSLVKRCRQNIVAHCNNEAVKCLYELVSRQSGLLAHCSNGLHLDNCTYFQCADTFKCPNYYCVPFRYVCDGLWDCPLGTEEFSCNTREKAGYFHCFGSIITILPSSICDNVADCPAKDDEYACGVHLSLCPPNCICVVQSIMCVNATPFNLPPKMGTFHFVSVEGDSDYQKIFLHCHWHVVFLFLSNIFHEDSCALLMPYNTPMLSVSILTDNYLPEFSQRCSNNFGNAKFFGLSQNKISRLGCFPFKADNFVHHLTLSHNNIAQLSKCHFSSLQNLVYLNLRENPIVEVEIGSMQLAKGFEVIVVVSKSVLCCFTEDSQCSLIAETKTCQKLLDTVSLEVTAWVSGIFGLIFNGVLIFLCIAEFKSAKKRHSEIRLNFCAYVLLLCISVVFLFTVEVIIGAPNIQLGTNFPIKQSLWKSSETCHVAYWMYNFYFVFNTSISLLLELSRYCVVYLPLTSKFKKYSFNLKVLSWHGLVLLFALVSGIFVLEYKGINFVHSRCCLPVGLSQELSDVIVTGVFLSVVVLFMVINTLIFVRKCRILNQKEETQSHSNTNSKAKLKVSTLLFLQCLLFGLVETVLLLSSLFSELDVSPYLLACVSPFQAIIHPVILWNRMLKRTLTNFGNRNRKQ